MAHFDSRPPAGDNRDNTMQLTESIYEQKHNRYYDAHGLNAVRAFFINFFNFKGRSSRREFWQGIVFATAIYGGLFILTIMLLYAFIGSLFSFSAERTVAPVIYYLVAFLLLALLGILLTPMMTLTLRRFCDVGSFTWLFYILNLPLLGIQLIYFYALILHGFSTLTHNVSAISHLDALINVLSSSWLFHHFGIAMLIVLLPIIVIAALPAKPLKA